MPGTPAEVFDDRSEPFSYVCGRCGNCCRNKSVQLNPYEIARLARNRGISTAEFRMDCTEGGQGTRLSRDKTGACIFLGADGCTVHEDRPLVCRLYPLGRRMLEGGRESFIQIAPHPESPGTYSTEGTLATFLAEQKAGPFLDAADGYMRWFSRALRAMPEFDRGGSAILAGQEAMDILDPDRAIADYSKRCGGPEPIKLEERWRLHINILDDFLKDVKGDAP